MTTRIRFVSAQPDQPHFVWQTEVYLESFLSLGIPAADCVALFGLGPSGAPSPQLKVLRERFPEVDLRAYPDERDADGRAYSPSIQPHLNACALRESPGWENDAIFYHDCDIAFRWLPDFDAMLSEHPTACLLSDTREYIGFGYLQKCCEEIRNERPSVPVDGLLREMCATVGIDPELVRENDRNAGGAQYLFRGVGVEYWEKVYRDSLAIHQLFGSYFHRLDLKKPAKDYIQIWTAGMWAYLWNLWLGGYETVVHPELKFLFSGASSSETGSILHMAGLPDELRQTHYNKEDWQDRSPVEAVKSQPWLFAHLPKESVGHEYATFIHAAAKVPLEVPADPTPSRFWRLLTWWGGDDRSFWDVEHLKVELPRGVSMVGHVASGDAGVGYEVANAFDTSEAFWGGRAESHPESRSFLYLGFELDGEAVPSKLKLTQSLGEHCTKFVLVQFSKDGLNWRTTRVARLAPNIREQCVFYVSEEGQRARAWRVVARSTTSGFAWDIRRLGFFRGEEEEVGISLSSGFIDPENPNAYGPDNAFRDDSYSWGGRRDSDERFHLGVQGTGELAIDRVVIDQGEAHWAARLEIQYRMEGSGWTPFRIVDGLAPGYNEIHLFEKRRPAVWIEPRVESVPDDCGT